ncbi:3-keto-disaccharide hydrolase [Sphingobacterium thalpophilum]|uniref:3-keto-disaccharide hydrolase n=1 Tax=Sphingobacterium thalpophilum TaxID=259 RepID=UPI003C7947FB
MRRNTAFLLGILAACTLPQIVVAKSPTGAPVHYAQEVDGKELIGRWDIEVDVNGTPAPSWLEVKLSGFKTLVGHYVSTSGSARPVSQVFFENGKFRFAIPPQWESGKMNLSVEGEVVNGVLQGTITEPDGKTHRFKGVRAPELKRAGTVKWGKPIQLFNGKDLTGWKATGKTNQWIVKNGVLTSPQSGSNLVSEQKFEDFKLHVEFKIPSGSNSGVYLRGRYEVQIEDSPKDAHPSSVLFAGVYGFLAANEMVNKGADQWQTYDITLVGRLITVVANGKTVISNQEIPGITGGALDSREAEPGPIYFQGDHGPVEFRKVVITPAVKNN